MNLGNVLLFIAWNGFQSEGLGIVMKGASEGLDENLGDCFLLFNYMMF